MATKTSDPKVANARPPMVFTTPGVKPDTLLQVFEQSFHASSMSLKMHSAFSRKFLDSPDKALAPQMPGFKYAWTSLVDADGTWSLVCDPAKPQGQSIRSTYKLKTSMENEMAAFKILMSAIHSIPFDIKTLEEIILVTKMADYYCSLPILSSALYRSCLRNPAIHQEIRSNPCGALETAAKLRNDALFKDCAIHAMNPWGSPAFRNYSFQDKELKLFLKLAYGALCEKVTNTDQRIRSKLEYMDARMKGNFFEPMKGCLGSCLPAYYRCLFETSDNGVHPKIKAAIGPMLENKLIFGGGDSVEVGAGITGVYHGYFLCIDIPDEDLPWDVNEREW